MDSKKENREEEALMMETFEPIKGKVAKPKYSSVAFKSALTAATVLFAAALIVNGLATTQLALKVGLKNTTTNVSNLFYTQITPAGWTFIIWSVIYTWQVVWLGYGWTFVLQGADSVVPYSPLSLILYTGVNVLNILWIILWGLELPQYSFPTIFILELLLYASINVEATYLFKLEDTLNYLTTNNPLKFNLNFARYMILNGMSIYAAWITVANLINLDIVLSYYGPVTAAFGGSLSLVLLGADAIIYYILENTLLQNFSRYVFVVYPVFAWALSGVLYAHADEKGSERNELITLVLLVGTIVLAVVQVTAKRK